MAEILKFSDAILPNEANPGLVETLEILLGQAKSGELRAMAYATVRTNNVRGTGWDGSDGTRDALSGAIMMLHSRYASDLLKGK